MVQKEADHEQLRSEDPKPPHFFKIIIQDSIEHGDFVFPKRFIRMYGEKLLGSDAVRLRVPTGDVWEMELRRCNDGSVWLEKKRWRSFASFYSLGFGHLLVFRFIQVGNGIYLPEFEVIICDKSTSEIKYPKVMCSIKAEPSDGGCMQDQERVIRSQKKQLRDRAQSPDSRMNPLKKKRKISKASSPKKLDKAKKGKKRGHDHNKKYARKMHSLNSTEKVEPSCMQDRERVIPSRKKHLRDHESPKLQLNPHKKMNISKALLSWRLEKGQKGEERDHNKKKYARKMHPLNSIGKAEALLRAESFRSANPYFKMVMQPSYVNSRDNMSVPALFMQAYMPGKTGQVKLVCASNGKIWTTRYYICKTEGSSFLKARISHGWETFAKENQLVVGDVCVFELIKGVEGEVSFRVTICRAPQAAKSNTVDDEVAVTSKSVPRHPFFQIVIHSSSLTTLTVPASFAKMHFDLERKEQMLTLEHRDGSWSVKLLNYKYKTTSCMTAGVRSFVKGNSLKVGDLCTFELIDSKQMVFKVSFTRNATVMLE